MAWNEGNPATSLHQPLWHSTLIIPHFFSCLSTTQLCWRACQTGATLWILTSSFPSILAWNSNSVSTRTSVKPLHSRLDRSNHCPCLLPNPGPWGACAQFSSPSSQRRRRALLIFLGVIAQGRSLNSGFKHRAAPWLLPSSKAAAAVSRV